MTQVAQLVVSMAADVARLKTDMERARKTVEGATGQMAKAADRAKKALGAIGAALMTGAAIKGLTSFIKEAVDAADEMSKLSQKTGVAMKDVAGLQLAFKQSGLQAGAFQQSMTKLSQAMTDGNKAFQTLGLSATKTDGTLKTTRQMLGDVADRFAGMGDGARKTALAVQIFGRAGADMIPLLNGGAASLDSFDETARKLGLTLDDGVGPKAEQFNDTMSLIGMASKGIGRQIMAELLPTMNSLAGAFFNSMTEGNRLEVITQALGVAFKILANIIQVVFEGVLQVFRGIRMMFELAKNNVLTLVGAIRQALTGDISGAFNTLQSGARDSAGIVVDFAKESGQAWMDTGKNVVSVWTGAGNETVAALANVAKATRQAAPVMKDAEKTTKARADAQRELNKELDDFFKLEEKARQQTEKSIRSAREMVEAIEFETKALQMTNTEREIAIKLRELERNGIKKGSREYEEFSKRIREAVVGNEAVRASQEAQRQARANWEKTWDQVAQSMTDAMMNGGVKVKDLLRNMFKTLVLRPILDPIMKGMTGSIQSMFGGGGGSMGNVFSQMMSGGGGFDPSAMFSGFTDSIAFASDTAGQWLVNNTTGALNQAGGSMMTNAGAIGTYGGMAAGALGGMALNRGLSGGYQMGKHSQTIQDVSTIVATAIMGPVGGIIAGAGNAMMNRLYGRKITEAGMFARLDGGMTSASGSFTHAKGGLLRSDKTTFSANNDPAAQAFAAQAQAVAQSAQSMAGALGLAKDGMVAYTGEVKVNLKGVKDAEEAQRRINHALDGMLFASLGASEGLNMTRDQFVQMMDGVRASMEQAGITAENLGNVIAQGMTGRLTQAQVGEQLADIVIGGIYNSIAANYANQISQVFTQQIITPLFTAMAAGVPLSQAISQEAIANVVATANQAAAALGAIFNDPGFKAAIGGIQRAISGIAGATSRAARFVPRFGSAATQAAEASKRAAEEIKRAWQQISDSITDEIRRIRGELVKEDSRGLAFLQSQFAIATAQARAGDQEAAKRLPELSRAILDMAKTNAATMADLQRLQGQTAASLISTRQVLANRFNLDIPQFAVGTNYVPQDMVAMVHKGEAIVPKAYNPSADNAGNEKLISEVSALRAEVRAVVTHTSKTAKILDRVSPDGTTLAVSTQ